MTLKEFKVWGRKREEKDSLYIWAKDADDAIGIARLTDQSICISQWTGNETTIQEITAEFAIEYLLDDCEDCPENKDGECMTQSHCFEVKQMAIKALEKEPCDDVISRQAAIDALDVLCQEHRYKIPGKRETYSQYNEAWQDALDRAEGAIFSLPSAQPEIIRCKDCKWFGDIGCAIRIVDDSDEPNENDFCSFAERRTDD